MYEYIRGILKECGDSSAVLESGGLGYIFFVTASTLNALGETGGETSLYVHLLHREDLMELYGFADRAEREVFRKLLSISGIGAKQAHKILSGMDYRRFIEVILADDISGLTSIPGLGKKRAEKIAFELKDKVRTLSSEFPLPAEIQAAPEEAILALEALGFSAMMAQAAVRRGLEEVEDRQNIQAVIRAALRHV